MICAKLIFNQKSNSLHNEDVTPKSVRKSPRGKKLQKKGHRMDAYKSCTLCPRNCKIDRTQGKTGFCKETDQLRLAVACLHFGEEPPITVNNGSGTIFVTGCNLRCAFCQNYQISQCGMGKALNIEETVQIFFQLKEQGAVGAVFSLGSLLLMKKSKSPAIKLLIGVGMFALTLLVAFVLALLVLSMMV